MNALDLAPGQALGGRYAVRRLLGRTHHAATYHAFAMPNRDVALKVLAPSLSAEADRLAQLRQVIAATNALPERLTLHVLEVGVDAETQAPFVVSNLSPTPSLAELVELCPLALPEVVSFVKNLAIALEAAHASSLLHLALKPTNVFVGSPPRCEVRIGDFGARALAQVGAEDAWCAPELAAGSVPNVGADVYGAALLTFFAATGMAPKPRSNTRMTASEWLATLGAPLDPRLKVPLTQALAADPAQRPASVISFARAVTDALAADPSPLPRLGTEDIRAPLPSFNAAEATARPRQAHPIKLRLVAALAAALVAGGAVIWMLASPKRKATAAVNSATLSTVRATASAGIVAPLPGTDVSVTHGSVPPAPSAASVPAAAQTAQAAAVPHATLEISCKPDCDVAKVDGVTMTSVGGDLEVDPGSHTVVAHSPGLGPQTKTVTVSDGEDKAVLFEWTPKSAPAQVRAASTPSANKPPSNKPAPSNATLSKPKCGKFLKRCN